jgi:tetratricopeptide (TPR) repeat protein
MALADLLYDLGYLDDAQSEYLKITEKWPMLADAQFAIATIYNKKGILDFAEKRYLKVVELNTSRELTIKAYINLGIIESNKTDRENPERPAAKGLEYIQKALEFNPSDKDALTALGLIYYKRGAYDRAIETFYLIVKSSDDGKIAGDAYNNIGKAHFKKAEYREALRAFNLGVESDPSNEEIRMNRKAASQAYENTLKTY